MTVRGVLAIFAVSSVTIATPTGAQQPGSPAEGAALVNNCITCHAEPELWEGDDVRYYVTPEDLARDVHWRMGLRCQDCHGGKADSESYAEAHAPEEGFHELKSPAEIPGFCGRCHSDGEYMRRYTPTPRTDQESEYWRSGHGRKLREGADAGVATCVSCHGHHGIVAIDDLSSPVYPTHVADTCASCHGDAERMAGREYEGRPIGHGQPEKWRSSVHARAMMEGGDLSAPTCNDCHGNHGALPSDVGSIANVCGSCHGRAAELFSEAVMKHRFEDVGLPGCGTCHGYHDVGSPSDEMLGMGDGTVCARCHEDGRFGATLTGAHAARDIRDEIELLKRDIARATGVLDDAERLGMEVRPARFELAGAHTALTNARMLIHGFSSDQVQQAVEMGRDVASAVTRRGEEALEEHERRRVWLGFSLVVIVAMIGVLMAVIRRTPLPEHAPRNQPDPGAR